MRMPLPAVAPAMLLVALGFAPRTGRHDLRDEYRAKGGSTGGCSLQEAIYSANLHTNAAVDFVNADGADHFITTRCVARAMTPSFRQTGRYPKWPIPCFWAKRLGATLSGYGR